MRHVPNFVAIAQTVTKISQVFRFNMPTSRQFGFVLREFGPIRTAFVVFIVVQNFVRIDVIVCELCLKYLFTPHKLAFWGM